MKECTNCILTEKDYPSIKLDTDGLCDICNINLEKIAYLKNQNKEDKLNELLYSVKKTKRNKYDCLIGISGGTDSSYLVFLAKKWGLNPLLLHIDGGWNSEKSVSNIEKIVDNSGFDFITEVLPWSEMKDLQLSFIKANVVDIDVPFDNAVSMYNYKVARKYKIKYIFNGYSTETEGFMPPNFCHYKYDGRNIFDIQKKFGTLKLNKLKILNTWKAFYYNRVCKIQFLFPLDLVDYNKEESKEIISNEFQWQDYGGKHYESVFTRFYQGYILPNKFKIDKRKSHLSMLICAKQISRSEALKIIEDEPIYPNRLMERDDKIFFCKKLGVSLDWFDSYILEPRVSHRHFKSDLDFYDRLRPTYRFFKQLFRK